MTEQKAIWINGEISISNPSYESALEAAREHGNLEPVRADSADLYIKIDRYSFRGCVIKDSSIESIRFSNCTFEACDFASLSGSGRFDDCEFIECGFYNCAFIGIRLLRCQIQECSGWQTSFAAGMFHDTVVRDFTEINPLDLLHAYLGAGSRSSSRLEC